MARKSTPDELPIGNSPEPQKFQVSGHVGKFSDGEIVTAADLFPTLTEPADIDAALRRLIGLNAIFPLVAYTTPEPEIVPEPPGHDPFKVTQTDARELAGEVPPEPATVADIKAPLPPLHFPPPTEAK